MTGTAASGASARSRFDDSVFISYSHADNMPFGLELGHGERNWVTFMGEELAKRLRMVSGDETSVWRDPKLQGNDVFADELVERLRRCAVLVSVCTPKYLNSEWCQRELETFVHEASRSGGLELGTKSRVFKVVKTPIDRDELPPPLEPLLGYEFYGIEEDGAIREFLLMHQPDGLVLFYQRLDDLVRDIARLLDEMEGEGTSTSESTVFLAETTSDVDLYRDDLKRELDRRGHRVYPDGETPLVADEVYAATTRDLAGSRTSVHILGSHYGLRPEGEERSIGHIQLDLASEAAGSGGLHQLVWIAQGLGEKEETQQELIDHLETERPGANIELIAGSFESFKTYLLDRLAAEPANEMAPPAGSTTRRVYLVHDPIDREPAILLRDQLEDRGLKVMTPLFEGTESEVSDVHRDSMVLSDAVLIYHGQTSEAWARTKVNDLIKARGWGRTDPFLSAAVVLGPPATPSKADFHSAEALVIDATSATTAPNLEPFLDQLTRSGHAR